MDRRVPPDAAPNEPNGPARPSRPTQAVSFSTPPFLGRTNRMRDQQATLPIQHGGNQSAIRARLRLGNRPLLDFSAPLNGLGPPQGAVAAVRRDTDSIGRYPEPNCPRLVERLAEFHGIPAEFVMVGAGTTDVISMIGQSLREELLAGARAEGQPDRPVSHLVEPTYGEYRRTAAQNGLNTRVWDRAHARLGSRFRNSGSARNRLDLPPEQPDRPRLGSRPLARSD